MKSKDADFWQAEVEAELSTHRNNQTWKPVPCAEGNIILTSKWIFIV